MRIKIRFRTWTLMVVITVISIGLYFYRTFEIEVFTFKNNGPIIFINFKQYEPPTNSFIAAYQDIKIQESGCFVWKDWNKTNRSQLYFYVLKKGDKLYWNYNCKYPKEITGRGD